MWNGARVVGAGERLMWAAMGGGASFVLVGF